MSEYVPTTEMRDRIEDTLMDYGQDREDAAYSSMVKPDLAGALAEILSVLAVARREGLAQGWDEGHDAATDEAPDGVWPDVWIDAPNPYRETGDDL